MDNFINVSKIQYSMRDLRLVQMEDLGLIVDQGNDQITIVPRNRAWLEQRGMLPYDKLPLSWKAIAANTGQDSLEVQYLHPSASGVEISRRMYDELQDMPPVDGKQGLKLLFSASDESELVDPRGPPLNVAMLEVYTRLKKLFPDKNDSWRKTEALLYFGQTVG